MPNYGTNYLHHDSDTVRGCQTASTTFGTEMQGIISPSLVPMLSFVGGKDEREPGDEARFLLYSLENGTILRAHEYSAYM